MVIDTKSFIESKSVTLFSLSDRYEDHRAVCKLIDTKGIDSKPSLPDRYEVHRFEPSLRRAFDRCEPDGFESDGFETSTTLTP